MRLSGDRRYGLTFILPLNDGGIPSEQGRGPSGRVSGRARNGSLANASIASAYPKGKPDGEYSLPIN